MPARVLSEPLTVHLAHIRPDIPGWRAIPPRRNDDWMLLDVFDSHRFRCALGARASDGPCCYLIPPGFAFAVAMSSYRHASAHFSSASYRGWDETVRHHAPVDDRRWPRRALEDNPVTLRLDDATWRLVNDHVDRHALRVAFVRLASRFGGGDRFRTRLDLLAVLELLLREPDDDDLAPFLDHLARSAHEPRSVPDLARRCGLSAVQFTRRCRARFGATPKELILRTRLDLARELLRQGVAVHAAAEACGFDDPYYFSRLFRRRVGVPPSRYRSDA